jgi:hypothetical protein
MSEAKETPEALASAFAHAFWSFVPWFHWYLAPTTATLQLQGVRFAGPCESNSEM